MYLQSVYAGLAHSTRHLYHNGNPHISQSLVPAGFSNVQCGHTRAPPPSAPASAIWSYSSAGMSSSIPAWADADGADAVGRAGAVEMAEHKCGRRSQGKLNCLQAVSRVNVISVCQLSVRRRSSSTVGSSKFDADAVRTRIFMSSWCMKQLKSRRKVEQSDHLTGETSCVVSRNETRCQSLSHFASSNRCWTFPPCALPRISGACRRASSLITLSMR